MVTDPIADLLTRIKNAGQAGHPSLLLPFSKIKFEIANALVRAGYVKSAEVVEKSSPKAGSTVDKKKPFKYLNIVVSYTSDPNKTGKKIPKINKAWRISKVSKRVYSRVKDLKPVRQGYGTAILSTTKGILTDKEARREKLGGEMLLKIW